MNQSMNLKPYVIRFMVFYTLSVFVFAGLSILLELYWDIEIPSMPVVIAEYFIGVYGASSLFIKQQQRIFTPTERKQMTLASWIASWLLSLLFVVIVALIFQFIFKENLLAEVKDLLQNDIGLVLYLIISIIVVLLLALSYFVTYWMYGFIPKTLLKPQSLL